MMKIIYILILILFSCHKEIILQSSLIGLNIWIYKLFPLLFPTFIIIDLILSTDLIDNITAKLGSIYKKIFKNNKYGLSVFIIGLIAGSPSNIKVLKKLKDKDLISDLEINKILTGSIFFNPLLIISICGIKGFFILMISNLITLFIFRNIKVNIRNGDLSLKSNINITDAIASNMNILISILGTIVFFSVLINIIPIKNIYVKLCINILLEISNSLNFIDLFFNNNLYFYLIAFSFGGLSILMQIKSILKDTFIDYKLYILSRLVVTCISIFICWCT